MEMAPALAAKSQREGTGPGLPAEARGLGFKLLKGGYLGFRVKGLGLRVKGLELRV